MARVAGIQIETNANGALTYARIDLKKHGEKITPILQELGAIDDDFDKDWNEGGFTIEEARKHLHKKIDSLPWKK